MRSKKEIENDHRNYEPLMLEVLLDIRELLKKKQTRNKNKEGK
jgi:hypothetical protein